MDANLRDDDEFEMDMDDNDYKSNVIEDSSEDDTDNDLSVDNIELDDETYCDDVIEIREDDLTIIDSEIPVDDSFDNMILSKHKISQKHSLGYDSIFKGKKEESIDSDLYDSYGDYYKESIEVDKSSNYYSESMDNERHIRTKLLKERVYEVLSDNTEINFNNNRRKPSKTAFNEYYGLLVKNLEEECFTNIELFDELSYYFSDNTLNMFKLLDSRWRTLIFKELKEHVGKRKTSKDVRNSNIYEGTEIEFIWEDNFGHMKHITGIVKETDYENSSFKVDSFENIYLVFLDDITKILNNNKYKYNLNKLNDVDFI